MAISRLAKTGNESQECPYLGLSDDPETAYLYPSLLNHCIRAKPAAPVKLDYQGSCCLSESHSACMVYQKEAGFPLPNELKGQPQRIFQRKWFPIYLWLIPITLAIVGVFLWQGFVRGLVQFDGGESSTGWMSDLTPSGVPKMVQHISTPTLPPSAPVPSRTIATLTPALAALHALETPIGVEHQFIIHRVVQGESFPLLAQQHGTTVEAIQLVNYNIQIPLMVNSLIVIPLNQTDVSGLPAFVAYKVKRNGSVEDLARQLLIDPALLEYYNDLKGGQVLAADDWVLVPHLSSATP